MKRYRLKPRFYVITITAVLLVAVFSIIHVDRVCKAAEIEEPTVELAEGLALEDLGECVITAYCSCEKCCGEWADNRPNGIVYGSTGKELKEGYSIAVDPAVIPYGSKVLIYDTWYEAMDCGGGVKGNKIDIYFDSHEDAEAFGVKEANVYVLSEG